MRILNPSLSAKTQEYTDTDIFQMTLTFSLFTIDWQVWFYVERFLADFTQKIMQGSMQLYADVHTMSAMSADVCTLPAASAQIESLMKLLLSFE